nr:hypothetical protein CFP56_79539 [Quercus suber]
MLPKRLFFQTVPAALVCRNAAEEKTEDEHGIKDLGLERLQAHHPCRQFTASGEEVQVADEHSCDEHAVDCSIRDIDEVEHHADLAPQSSIAGCAGKCHEGAIDDHTAAPLHRKRPGVRVVREERVAAGLIDPCYALELFVPFP